MSTLLITTCHSGAGHLKFAKQADRILAITYRLLTGPVPLTGSQKSFLKDRLSAYKTEGLFYEEWWFSDEDVGGKRLSPQAVWSELPGICLEYDRVELWVDPDPNAHLLLLQLLDWLGQIPEIASRLWLNRLRK